MISVIDSFHLRPILQSVDSFLSNSSMHAFRSILGFSLSSVLLIGCVALTPEGQSDSSPPSADIHVSEPDANTVVSSPLTVRGEARGTWYFEASFPVRLLDSSGNELAVAPAQAQDDWMTIDFVPFEVTLTYTTTSATGSLVLEKDNPSGEPQNAASIVIPVRFVP